MPSLTEILSTAVPIEVQKTPSYQHRGVKNSEELRRILHLPTYTAADFARAPIEELIQPTGDIKLKPVQRQALAEAWFTGGLYAPLAVGTGKTLIAFLLPTVLEKRAVILAPSGTVKQMQRLWAEYAKSFFIRDDIELLSYHTLSNEVGVEALQEIDPEMIIADEVQNLGNVNSARGKRFRRFMKEHPHVLFMALSGTMMRRSIKEPAPFMTISLGESAPVPSTWADLTEWAEAIDPGRRPRKPGALMQLAPLIDGTIWPHENQQDIARRAFRSRLHKTAGVVGSVDSELGVRLVVRCLKAPKSEKIEKALRDLEENWRRADGEELVQATDIARVSRQIRLGGFYRWRNKPEADWFMARADWHKELRSFLKSARPRLDSPLLVSRAITRGDLPLLAPTYNHWQKVKAQYEEPEVTWEWIDEELIHNAVKSLVPPSLVWFDCLAPAQKVASRSGNRFYGSGQDFVPDEQVRSGKGSSAVLSIQSHGVGKNYQVYARNLVMTPPVAGDKFTQLIGRTYRQGQTSPEVLVEFYDSFLPDVQRAVEHSKFLEATDGSTQLLLHCEKEGWE